MTYTLTSYDLDPTLVERFLGEPILAILRQAAQLAEAHAWQLYLVGGPVRDLLLGLPATDLDLVVRGDALVIAQELASRTHAKLLGHTQFGTATIILEHLHLSLDIVTARREYYEHAAALPIVEPSNLRDDLLRRDFSVNTLAVALNAAVFARLYDACNGRADLQQGLMRVLHDRSFIDDPTRLIRMARIAGRLGFAIEEHTLLLTEQALQLHMLGRTTPARILHELELTLADARPGPAFALLRGLGILRAIHPALSWSEELAAALEQLHAGTLEDVQALSARELADLRLMLLLYPMDVTERMAFAGYYGLTTHRKQLIEDINTLHQLRVVLRTPDLVDSVVDRSLHSLHDLALLSAHITEPSPMREHIQRYRAVLRNARPALTGSDLQAMRIPPGPVYRILLEGLRAAFLDGVVTSEAEQRAWIRQNMMSDA